MSHERIERAIKVEVPEELFRQLFPDGKQDEVTDYILGVNSFDVAGTLLASGTIDTTEDVSVTFVPAKGMPKETTLRPVKIMEVRRDREGNIVDVRSEESVIEWMPNHDN